MKALRTSATRAFHLELAALALSTLMAWSSLAACSAPEDAPIEPAQLRSESAESSEGRTNSILIPPGHEDAILALSQPLPPGLKLRSVQIEPSQFTYLVDVDANGQVAAVQIIWNGDLRLEPAMDELGAAHQAVLSPLIQQISRGLTHDFVSSLMVMTSLPFRNPVSTTLRLSAMGFALLAWLSLWFWRESSSRWLLFAAALLWFSPLTLLGWKGIEHDELWLHVLNIWGFWLTVFVCLGLLWRELPILWRELAILWNRTAPGSTWPAGMLPDAALVLAWSLFVRLVLTTANILTDGGSLRSRLLAYTPDFGAIHVILSQVSPSGIGVALALQILTLLSALAPLAVLLLARAVHLSRKTSILGGLALASWPLHAAFFSSDFESGPTMSLALLGVALLAQGTSAKRHELVWVGVTLAGFALWGRPEALSVGVPVVLLLVWALHSGAWRSPSLSLAYVWLGSIALVRVIQLANSNIIGGSAGMGMVPFLYEIPWGRLFGTRELFPLWVFTALLSPLLVFFRQWKPLIFVLAGCAGGLAPLILSNAPADQTTHMEVFRYGVFVLPWIALMVGMGLAATTDLLLKLPPLRGQDSGKVVAALTAALLLSSPLIHRHYLATLYGPRVEWQTFYQFASELDPHCILIAPDDEWASAAGQGTHEIHHRYTLALQSPRPKLRTDTLLRPLFSASQILAHLGDDNVGPIDPQVTERLSTLVNVPAESGASAAGDCWYFFRGFYCDDGWNGTPVPICDRFLERVQAEPERSVRVAYRHHRTISYPDLRLPPLGDTERELILYRLPRLADELRGRLPSPGEHRPPPPEP